MVDDQQEYNVKAGTGYEPQGVHGEDRSLQMGFVGSDMVVCGKEISVDCSARDGELSRERSDRDWRIRRASVD